ncbi:hypothetical protein V6N11_064216 [Hibiscus sabdariffa]|uniref:Uncharacterized protein n=1 Tax=Hibiscus sabdariffa TaxID=183260 RepID=A0ABR2PN01_9ROSI
MCVSSALPRPVLHEWETITGHCLLERYGMTIFINAISNPLKGPRKADTVGKPFPGVQNAVCLAYKIMAKLYLQSTARLAQLVHRKALNLVVVGLSPTVGVIKTDNEAADMWKPPAMCLITALAWRTGNECRLPAIATTIPVDHIRLIQRQISSRGSFHSCCSTDPHPTAWNMV